MKWTELLARLLLIGVSMGLSFRFIVLYFQPDMFYKTNFFDMWFDWGSLQVLSWLNLFILFKQMGIIKLK